LTRRKMRRTEGPRRRVRGLTKKAKPVKEKKGEHGSTMRIRGGSGGSNVRRRCIIAQRIDGLKNGRSEKEGEANSAKRGDKIIEEG